uniref:Uncharacterized protein n=1 Tax=Leptobrachium leishanense TaxID=445787 RepID=A0A8C5N521_9ANUR
DFRKPCLKILKKKIAEEAAIAPRPGGATQLQRTISKESITSAGADSGDDFASDGSNSCDDLHSQISRRNKQIRRLEAKLTDYAEQVQSLQRMKEKLEVALEKHQDSSMRKLQEQLSDQVVSMKQQSISLVQKREEIDERKVFHQQEMAKINHMVLKKELLRKVGKDLRVTKASSHAELLNTRQWAEKLNEELRGLQEENSQLLTTVYAITAIVFRFGKEIILAFWLERSAIGFIKWGLGGMGV